MLRVDRDAGSLTALSETTLSSAGLGERNGLQELILQNQSVFFEQECNETLFVIREEVEPSSLVGDRIDLLALDTEGRAVVIELKRGNHKLQLLQSLTYAAMISDWTQDEMEGPLSTSKLSSFREFVAEHGIDEVNEFQRIILIAESFGFEVLKTATWLTDSYGFNITCYQLSLAKDAKDDTEYLSAVQVFPLRELATQVRRRGSLRSERANKFLDIEQLLPTCKNEEIVSFFKENLDRRRNKRRDSIVFPQLGKMRFRVRPQREYARVSQLGRFDGDQGFWENEMSSPALKSPGGDLRFRLHTSEDVEKFLHFVNVRMEQVAWTKSLSSDDDDVVEEE